MYRGYIKEYRKIVEWEWYTDINTCHLFRHCLYKANIEDKKWRGQHIIRGSFITSLKNLSRETGLTVRQVRTALNKLKMTNELTSESTNQNTVITVNNYEIYQDSGMQNDKQMTNERQTDDKRMTTTKECKEYKNERMEYIYTHTKEKNNVCVIPKISKEDREILKNYARKSKASNINAYVHTLIANGGYLEILEQEKQKAERKKQKLECAAAEKIEEKEDKEVTAKAYEDFKKKVRGIK